MNRYDGLSIWMRLERANDFGYGGRVVRYPSSYSGFSFAPIPPPAEIR